MLVKGYRCEISSWAMSRGCNAAQTQTQASLLLLSWSRINLLCLGRDPRHLSTFVLEAL